MHSSTERVKLAWANGRQANEMRRSEKQKGCKNGVYSEGERALSWIREALARGDLDRR